MKKRNIITALISVIALLAVAFCIGFYFIGSKSTEKKSNYELKDSDYNKSAITVNAKIYETDINGVYYSLSPVKYYKIQNDSFKEIKPSGTISKKINISAYQIPVKISYIKSGKQIFGVGEWKKSKVTSADSYIYAFSVLKNMPSAFGSSYSCILLMDTNDNGLPAMKRQFSEAIAINLNGDIGGYLFDQRNRTVENTGKLRTDWDLLTLSMINSEYNGYLPSVSGRMYSQSETAQIYDARITKSGKTSAVAENVQTDFARIIKSGLLYITQKESAFKINLKNLSSKKTTVIGTFDGNLGTDYIVRGDYALNKSDFSVISLCDGKKINLSVNFKKVYDFCVKGDTLCVVGKENNKDGENYKVQKTVIYNFKTGQKQVIYANDIMNENSPVFISNSYLFTQKDNSTKAISLIEISKMLNN